MASGDLEETPGRIDIALAIPVLDDRVLIARRGEGLHLAGKWEFPGGKVEAGEAPAEAARRELAEETGLDSDELEPLVVVVHDYAEMPLRLHVFLVREWKGEPRLGGPRELTWVPVDELFEVEMPEANRQMLRALSWRLGKR